MSSVKPNSSQLLGPLTALALLSLAAGSASAQTREIELGAVVPSSGPFAEWGRSNTVTLKMLEKQTNDAGGINGAKIKITILDDGAKPAQAASSLR
jgi:branched-chain amino acid transport system substrate-binding protein